MSAIWRSDGLVFRLLFVRQIGARVHVLQGEHELVLSPAPLRILQGEGPPAMRQAALDWAAAHRHEILSAWHDYADASPRR